MAVRTVKTTAKKVERKRRALKLTKRLVVLLFIILLFLFFVLMIVYKGGNFTVTLDPQTTLEGNIILYESKETKDKKYKLYAKEIEFMDNISIDWLPGDLDTSKDGAHNGENYIAYTFYVENQGKLIVNYWYEINILDVIKNVDEAIRVIIYQNGEKTVYAKENSMTKLPEPETVKFSTSKKPILKQRKQFKPNDIDKYTIVIYLEGDDPDCVDAIIGGEIKMDMKIREEHIENGK